MGNAAKVAAKPQDLTGKVRGLARLVNKPLLHGKELAKSFAEPPAAFKDLPAFYMQHLRSLFKDPKKLKLALTDITPLSALGLLTAVPSAMAANKLMPHRRMQNIAGMVGNILGGQVMQRTGLIGGLLGAVTGETLGRTIAMPFERNRSRAPDISQALSDAASSQIGRVRRATGAMDNVMDRAQQKFSAETGYTHSIRDEGKNKRYDVHKGDVNVAYAFVHPKSTEGDGPWVSGLYVDPKHRGQDLAKGLMNRIEADHSGQTVRLRAKPYKDKAMGRADLVKFYTERGYSPYDASEPTRLKKSINKTGTAEEAMTVGPRVQTTEPNIGGSFPAQELQEVPEEQMHDRNVANRGNVQPEDYLFLKRLLTSLTGGGIGSNAKDPNGTIDSLHEDPEGWDSSVPVNNAIATNQVAKIPAREHPEIP